MATACAVAILYTGGCAGVTLPARTASPAASEPSAVPTVRETASLRPAASTTPPIRGSGTLDLQVDDLPSEATTPALAFTTDGDVLLWSSAAPDGAEGPAPDLWRYDPEMGEPERIYANPNRDSALVVIAGDGSGHYAFVEQNDRLFGMGGWRLWYLADPPGEPVQVDAGDVAEGLIPFFALTSERLVWTTLHGSEGFVQSQLLHASLPSLEVSVLDETPAEDREFLFPSLRGTQLLYSTLTVNDSGTGARGDVHLPDLAGDAEARQLNDDDEAFMGVLGDGIVVWQEPALANPLNGGRLVLHSLLDATTQPIEFGPPEALLNYHTVGDRYVAADSDHVAQLWLYDLQTQQPVLVEDLGDFGEGERPGVDVRPRVADNLLVFVRGSDDPDVDLVLKWATLPGTET